MENKSFIVTIPTLGIVTINFYGISLEVINLFEKTNEFERQKEIKHLGLIAKVFEGSSHSRYDYVMLQCALVDLVDNLHKGSPNLSLGNLKVDGEGIPGNSIMKSWFLLSNFGHTKFTFGDEKAIILYAIKTKGFKSQLLRPIQDSELKSWCDKVIMDYNYSKMHYVLAIRRIYKETARNIKTREKLIKLIKLLLLDKGQLDFRVNEEKLEQLKRLFNVIRKLSIISIDGHYSHIPVTIDLIASIISLGSIENTYNNKSLIEQLQPIISLLHDEIYLNKRVLELQRNYEIESQNLLSAYKKEGVDTLIELALTKGLHSNLKNHLKHFARLKLKDTVQNEIDFKSDLNELAKVRTGCRDTEFSIDYNPVSGLRFIDFFLCMDKFSHEQLTPFIFNMCNYIDGLTRILEKNANLDVDRVLDNVVLLGEENEFDKEKLIEILIKSRRLTFPELNRRFMADIIPLYKELLWSILRHFIKDQYSWDVNIQTRKYPQFIFNVNGKSNGLKRIFDFAIENEPDSDRAFEILQLKKSATRSFEGFILASMARITIYDITKSPNERIVTDIDSVLMKVNKNKLIVEFHESKNTKRTPENNAKRDLRNKFIKVLNDNAKGYRINEVKGMGAKLVVSFKTP
ncbi:hypothetical protein [Lysinibacillus sp. G01H]|uniref:hypothetical protein n=1 Tax=Lysinibacillus sp. G01H TaxID=3026425 RepID=UPI00237E9237|nr:hypothetical protein [Lysinibacillus sp. G01H]WDU77707.1 hypothetical protein PSR12_13515 [Lysinibacillus sp. G01H]